MSIDPLTSIIDLGKSVISRVWPDPVKQAEELRKLEEMKQRGSLAEIQAHVNLMLGQLRVNEKEAQHKSVFVAGWRPWIGWVGGMAMAWQFIVYPMLTWLWAIAQVKGWIPNDMPPPPVLETGPLFALITGMLGIGGLRTYDKSKGTQTDRIN